MPAAAQPIPGRCRLVFWLLLPVLVVQMLLLMVYAVGVGLLAGGRNPGIEALLNMWPALVVLGWTVTMLWAARGALLRGQAPAWWWGLALLLPWSGLLLAVVSDLFIPGSPVYLRIGFANALAMPDNYIPLTLLLLVWGCWISGTLALRTAQGVARPAKG